MKEYFPYQTEPYLFTPPSWSIMDQFNILHIITIVLSLVIIYFIYHSHKDATSEEQDKFLYTFSMIGIALFIFRIIRRVIFYKYSLFTSLPLEICNISLFLMPIVIKKKSAFWYNYAYIISLSMGMAFLFVVPNIYRVSILNILFFEGQFQHLVTIGVPICLVLWKRFKPNYKYVLPMIGVLFFIACIDHIFNLIFNNVFHVYTNYLYTIGPINGTPLMWLSKIMNVQLFYMWQTLVLLGFLWYVMCLPWMIDFRKGWMKWKKQK